MKQQSTITGQGSRLRGISILISVFIIFLAAANGIFTYSGAYLYLEESIYALLFAVAVQFAIAVSLLALPYVYGLGKIALGIVYTAALVLSSLSAYTYIYNTSLPDRETVYSVDTGMKATITTALSDVLASEQAFLRESANVVAERKRLVEEEAGDGGRSGLGPGKGPVYYQKLDAYEEALAQNEIHNQNFATFRERLEAVNQQLAGLAADGSADEAVVRDSLLVALSGLRAVTNTDGSRETLTGLIKHDLGELQNPVERAMSTLLEPQEYSIQVIVGIIWAAVFDLVALFLGIVRYYLLRPGKPFFQALYDGLLGMALFVMKLFHLRKEAAFRFSNASGYQQHKHQIPLDSPEMQSFATRLLVGSQMAAQDEDDPAEPLHTLISYIQPLHLEGEEQQIGIPFEQVEGESRLKTLLAMLIQSGVFLHRRDAGCYVLNPAENMAQKVMVFIRMGLKNAEDLRSSPVAFLLASGQQPSLGSAA